MEETSTEYSKTYSGNHSYFKRTIQALIVLIPLLLIIYGVYSYGYRTILDNIVSPEMEDWISVFASFVFTGIGCFLFILVAGVDDSSEKGFKKINSAFALIKNNFGALITTTFLFLIFINLGLIFLIIPGIIFVIMFYLFPFVVVFEKKRNIEALKRSANLVKRGWVRVAFAILMYYVLFVFIAAFLDAYVPYIGLVASETLSGAFVLPFEAMTFLFLYRRLVAKEEASMKKAS